MLILFGAAHATLTRPNIDRHMQLGVPCMARMSISIIVAKNFHTPEDGDTHQSIAYKRLRAPAIVRFVLLVESVERTSAHQELLQMTMACNQ
jgi:hypothetical protein